MPERKPPPVVFFFRGLSTYGVDEAKFGPFSFGPMYKNLERELRTRDLNFIPVTGMGVGSLAEIQGRALGFIVDHEQWHSTESVHLVGHSAGGLVARLVLRELWQMRPAGKVASLLTIATPHRGARAAQLGLDLPVTSAKAVRALKWFGYDVTSRAPFYRQWTRGEVATTLGAAENFSPTRQAVSFRGTRLGSIVCAAPRSQWCWPLRALYKIPAFQALDEESDGIVEKSSQGFAEVRAEIALDHIRQIGLFGQRAPFRELCQTIADFIHEAHR